MRRSSRALCCILFCALLLSGCGTGAELRQHSVALVAKSTQIGRAHV